MTVPPAGLYFQCPACRSALGAAAEILSSAQADGELDADLDVDALAAHIVGTIIGIVTQVYFQPGAIDPESVIDTAVRTLTRGALAPAHTVR